jgi:hypothetical protein
MSDLDESSWVFLAFALILQKTAEELSRKSFGAHGTKLQRFSLFNSLQRLKSLYIFQPRRSEY